MCSALAGVEPGERLVEHEDLAGRGRGPAPPSPAGACPWSRCVTGRRSVGSSSTSSRAGRPPRVGIGDAVQLRRQAARTRSAVSGSNSASCWGTRPMRPGAPRSARGSPPSTRTVPCDGAGQPAQQAQHRRLAGAVGAEQRGDARPDARRSRRTRRRRRRTTSTRGRPRSSRRCTVAAGRCQRRSSGHHQVDGSWPAHMHGPKPATIQPTVDRDERRGRRVVGARPALAVDALHQLERARRRLNDEQPLGARRAPSTRTPVTAPVTSSRSRTTRRGDGLAVGEAGDAERQRGVDAGDERARRRGCGPRSTSTLDGPVGAVALQHVGDQHEQRRSERDDRQQRR